MKAKIIIKYHSPIGEHLIVFYRKDLSLSVVVPPEQMPINEQWQRMGFKEDKDSGAMYIEYEEK